MAGSCASDTRDGGTRCRSTCSRASAALNTLRSFTDYRFHDDNMLLANAELRLALMTHLDLAVFADAGNVAARAGDLDLDKRSYGAGFRLHTRRETFAMVDVAHGDEGWRVPVPPEGSARASAASTKSAARAVRAVTRRLMMTRSVSAYGIVALTRDARRRRAPA